MLRTPFLFLVFIFFSVNIFSQNNINHWETIVRADEEWKYLPATSEPPEDWMEHDFEDTNWAIGQGGFGYGDNDDETKIDAVTSIYLRKSFQIIDLDNIAYAVLHADYDDAFIAYINGVEIARSNIGIVGDIQPFDALPTYFHDAQMYREGRPEYFEINKETINNVLTNGENTLAIQVQNDGIISSDLSAIFFFSVGLTEASQQYTPVPDWFQPPVFLTTSNLPIILINTNEQSIPDDPKIVAQMKIINNGNTNHIDDIPNEYNSRISIELRGSSSQNRFNKKSYGLETQLVNGDNNNVSLFGMPEENDWILYGPFSDKTLLRNDLIYHLARQMGQYAPRTAFCELVINEQYQGVYIFMEKIKIDKGRVDIAKLKPEDIAGDELTGGYILKIDKQTGSGGEGWFSSIQPPTYENRKVFFQYGYPKSNKINEVQKDYIQQYMHDFESALYSDNFKDTLEGYRKYIDVQSFIDFFIANELTYNVDGYRLSVFMHKQKDSNGGKLRMGPIWDFNLSMGSGWDCDIQNQENYMFDYNIKCPESGLQIPFWWIRLLEDEWFRNELKCSWDDYRQGVLNLDSILAHLDQQANYISEAKDRNFIRWPILEVKVHFNFFLGKNYEEELTFVKDWLRTRVEWLDDNLFGYCSNLQIEDTDQLTSILYPTPATTKTTFEYFLPQDSRVNLILYDVQGRMVNHILQDVIGKKGAQQLEIPIATLPRGVYFLTLFAIDKKKTHKLVKF